jgi:hypothetical protein
MGQSCLFQQHRVLRPDWTSAESVPHQQCEAGLLAELSERHQLRISWDNSHGVGKRDLQWIVWAVENSNPAVLHAYDATNLANELYNSSQAGFRDQFGPGNKFITPVIVNGKVFVGTQTGVAEFGLLH